MKLRNKLCLFLYVVGSLFIVSQTHAAEKAENKFKLKPGAQGKVCVTCHVDFEDKLKSPYLHTPVKAGNCTGCHNPHTSVYGKMLAADLVKVCYRCHKSMVPENARSAHKVVVEGNCVKCHDPHGAKNRFNLLQAGNELCFGCHKKIGETIAKAKFKHSPVEKGCLNCHNPHASGNAVSLLTDSVPSLCLKCHKTNTPSFTKQHMNYPVGKAVCTTCHNPHGSDVGGILYNNVHRPVASKMCNQCHEEPTSATPFATKKPGYELCRGCHSGMINDALAKKRIHWPLLSKKGCLSCHNPHASAENKLMRGGMIKVCGKCHGDTVARQERSETKHPPIMEGNCTACHLPHSSDNSFLLNQASVIDICGSCHDWQKHSTHPIGDKVVDPRNKNLTLQCLTCHRAHGTENKYFVYTPVITELCTQCHVQYKR